MDIKYIYFELSWLDNNTSIINVNVLLFPPRTDEDGMMYVSKKGVYESCHWCDLTKYRFGKKHSEEDDYFVQTVIDELDAKKFELL